MTAKQIRKVAISLSFATKTSLEYLLNISIFELYDMYVETKEMVEHLENGK